MRRRLDQLLPVLVLLGFLAAAIVLNLLLSSAQQRGVDALEESSAGRGAGHRAQPEPELREPARRHRRRCSATRRDPYELVRGQRSATWPSSTSCSSWSSGSPASAPASTCSTWTA